MIRQRTVPRTVLTTLTTGVALLLVLSAQGVDVERVVWRFGVLLALVPLIRIIWRVMRLLDDSHSEDTQEVNHGEA